MCAVDGSRFEVPRTVSNEAAAVWQPPLVLRLIVSKRKQKRVYFVSSILSRREMSDEVLLGIAQRRWGVELFYRSWKQTFDKRKLRSRKSAHALIELDWSLIALWGLCLLTRLHQRESRPGKSSVAKALRAMRRSMRAPTSRPERGQSLFELLSRARIDDYCHRQPKSSRDYPHKKQRDQTRAPTMKPATTQQRKTTQTLKHSLESAA